MAAPKTQARTQAAEFEFTYSGDTQTTVTLTGDFGTGHETVIYLSDQLAPFAGQELRPGKVKITFTFPEATEAIRPRERKQAQRPAKFGK